MDFDAIVVGSGMSGGWATKELAERGLKVLVVERGWNVEHGVDYNDTTAPWEIENRGRVAEDEIEEHYYIQRKCYAFNTANKHLWVKDSDHPYEFPEDKPFAWLRGYHLGGRSLLWARHSYRLSEMDFTANSRDGYGVDWPIRYADVSPWYDHAERFAGISGTPLGLPQVPDGVFLPPMELNAVEKDFKAKIERNFPGRKMIMGRVAHLTQPTEEHLDLGRGQCQYRDHCYRGCSFGAYFSSLSATLPAAQRTGNVTIVTDAIVEGVDYDPQTRRATGVRVIDCNSKARTTYQARVIFLCASTINSTAIMLNSTSEAFPNGIANRSGVLGQNLMDHISGVGATATVDGFGDRYYSGRRPAGIYIPRYINVTEPDDSFTRGFGFQGGASREAWQRGAYEAGVGEELKTRLRTPGRWTISVAGFGEMLPRPENRVTLTNRKDKWGIPIPRIECSFGENDLKIAARATQDAITMLESAGYTNVESRREKPLDPGYGIHEMGTARMGHDPATSVLNKYNQAHDVPNLFVTDGSCMSSSACQNPSLTYMALSARAAHHAAEFLREGAI